MIRQVLWNLENQDRTAIIDGNSRISYRALAGKAAALQKRLMGCGRGNIAILLPDGGDYIAALFAVLRAGMTAFPLSTRLTRHEIAALLSQADVRTVITCAAFQPLFDEISSGAAGLDVVYAEDFPASLDGELPAAADVGSDEPMLLLGLRQDA